MLIAVPPSTVALAVSCCTLPCNHVSCFSQYRCTPHGNLCKVLLCADVHAFTPYVPPNAIEPTLIIFDLQTAAVLLTPRLSTRHDSLIFDLPMVALLLLIYVGGQNQSAPGPPVNANGGASQLPEDVHSNPVEDGNTSGECPQMQSASRPRSRSRPFRLLSHLGRGSPLWVPFSAVAPLWPQGPSRGLYLLREPSYDAGTLGVAGQRPN